MYITLVKKFGADAGREIEVTTMAYNKNAQTVYKDFTPKNGDTPPKPLAVEPQKVEAVEVVEDKTTTQTTEWEAYTVKQLRQHADDNGIQYKMPINKAELIELIVNNTTK